MTKTYEVITYFLWVRKELIERGEECIGIVHCEVRLHDRYRG